mgnify:CR=1 FL=1
MLFRSIRSSASPDPLSLSPVVAAVPAPKQAPQPVVMPRHEDASASPLSPVKAAAQPSQDDDLPPWLDAPMQELGLQRARSPSASLAQGLTFPSRVPVFSMDRIYTRGLRCLSTSVPRGAAWARMSDHLPLVAELVAA